MCPCMRGGYFDDQTLQMDQTTPTVIDLDDEEEERDRPFNAYRFAFSEDSKTIVQEAIRQLLNCEDRFALKKNKRRAKDQETFDLTVDALLSDLMHHHLAEYPGGIYLSRSNRVLGVKSRYRPRAYSKMFPYILDLMAKPEMAYIEQDIAVQVEGVSRSTVIRPGSRLLDRIEEHGVQLGDLGEHPHGETIVLKRTKDADDYWDEGGLQEYDDNEATERYRAELADINDWLAAADLRFDPTGISSFHTAFDIRSRRLRRIFTQGRFTSGGRLFGGFWQELRKQERRQGLYIGRDKAVELDYGQVGPRILYGMAGRQPPSSDLYAMPGYYQQRAGIKRVMSAMIFASDSLDRFPKATRSLFRRSDKIGEVTGEIERRHPLIKDSFYLGLGHDAQFIESQIMIDVLLTLKDRDIVALPIHDAVMVPVDAVSIAKEIMLDTFHRHAHVEGTVTVEG